MANDEFIAQIPQKVAEIGETCSLGDDFIVEVWKTPEARNHGNPEMACTKVYLVDALSIFIALAEKYSCVEVRYLDENAEVYPICYGGRVPTPVLMRG